MEAKLEEKNQLVVLIDQNGLEAQTNESLKQSFLPFFEKAQEWEKKAKALVVTDVEQKREMQEARVARLALKDIRVSVEKRRKELKEDSLKKGKAIDTIAGFLKDLIEPIESHLEQQEKYAEIVEAKRKAELKTQRELALKPFGITTDFYKLDEMDEQTYQNLFDNARAAQEKSIEDARLAEEKRIAEEKSEAEARERIRLENERLKSEAAAREKLLAEERAKAEAERKAAEKKLQAEREKAEAEARRLKAEQDAMLEKERKQREQAEAELKAKAEAERKAAEEEQARLEAELSKGDKEKFQDLINDLEKMKGKYSFRSKKYKALAASVEELVDKTINWAISKQ